MVKGPEGTDYLAMVANVSLRADALMAERNFTLERGLVISGRLREKETGQPLRVPYVNIYYKSEETKAAPASTRTRPDGSFRIAAPPGKGKLVCYTSLPGCVPLDLVGDSDTDEAMVSLPIEIKAGETLSGKDLLFPRGMVVRGRVLDPEGRPVAGASFQGVTEQLPSQADGTFTLRGLSPRYRTNFLVVHAQRRLGARVTKGTCLGATHPG